MTKATDTKFDNEESFALGLFVKAHNGKSWVAFRETATGKPVKKVEITKTSDTGFQVEISSGNFVRCHMHWSGSLTALLRRMEYELLNPEFQEN